MVTPKHTRKAIEKIWNILQEIEEKRQLTAENEEIKLSFVPRGFRGTEIEFDILFQDRNPIFHKLESMEAIVALREQVEGMDERYWFFRLGKRYEEVFSSYETKYHEIAREYKQSKQLEEIEMKDPVYEVKYSEKTREILVNSFLLAKPDFYRENEVVFTYVYSYPNERISKERIEKENVITLTKTLPKILENLGFTEEIGKTFFDVSSKGILFRNPVTRKDLDELGIRYLKLK